MKQAVRFFFIAFFIFTAFLFYKSPVFAQNPVQPQTQPVNSYAAPNTSPDVPNNLHNWSQNVMIEVISAMTCQLAGVDPTNPSAKCLGVDQKTGKIGFVENGGGAIGVMGNLISMTLTPPIRTSDFIAYMSNSFGFTKPTYAAGKSGIDSLNPIVGVWSASRNIVYLLFVLVFVIIGIAIMFRVKIDPRTVMTVQNQIPKLIIGILLVTFSFAIAGLLIDIMWVAVYLFINVLIGADPKIVDGTATAGRITSNLNNTTLNFVNSNDVFKGGLLGVAAGGAGSVAQLIVSLFTGSGSATTTAGNPIVDLITNPVGTLLGAVMGWLLGFIGGILAFFIILIAILWSMFKLWFALLEAYIMILVGVIFAPFWIVTGLIPGGQSVGFGAWMREMLGNLAAFPTAIAMFLIGRILIDAFGTSYSPGQFVPPLLGNPQGNANSPFAALIALGLIFVTPHIVKTTKAAFKSPKIDLGPIGQAVGVGAMSPGRVIGGGVNAVLAPNYVRNKETGMQEIVYPHSTLGKALRAFGLAR
ncbi:MAG: hypothetical protein M1426_05005 [Patescibacteria group bacterium]|nr:hypothetical protein [Patescibacteria group bacterium]